MKHILSGARPRALTLVFVGLALSTPAMAASAARPAATRLACHSREAGDTQTMYVIYTQDHTAALIAVEKQPY